MKIYTCSMHPEVKSDKPGKCPKCGMELTGKNRLHIKNIQATVRLKDLKYQEKA